MTNKKVNMDLMINESYIMTIYTCMFDIRMKHLAQQMENIENQNKKRLDAIDKTNTSMLKAIYTLAKQDYKDSTKDGDKDVAMSETHENTYVYRQPLHFQNVNKRVSNPTVKCTTNQAYGKSDATLNNIETIFILGDDDDDDDEFLRPLDKGMKGKFVRDENTTTYSL